MSIYQPGTMIPVGKTAKEDREERRELTEREKTIADNLKKTVRPTDA